jgi:hypothetical protein
MPARASLAPCLATATATASIEAATFLALPVVLCLEPAFVLGMMRFSFRILIALVPLPSGLLIASRPRDDRQLGSVQPEPIQAALNKKYCSGPNKPATLAFAMATAALVA